ncbi:uncharacterized protein Hap1MRO34_008102 isoform 2-T2 [Clarias gariepinus]|uniref:actin nucleation-promoting factor WAS isoform X2 n=1 Tax=Clarias gariepinus TaxID=13013 RepID=UPI00234C8F0A|nr:actin nucleation-promoting factor WAS isoform X2 [Clarias gariepinus]
MSRMLSPLLTIRENGLVFNLLGSDCTASACAVVQLYLATRGRTSEWQKHSCGVVCLVQDKKLHSTFIRLFCRAKLLWEQELFAPFIYSTPRPFFHTFPSDECCAGLNFSDEDEASHFHTAVQNCIGGTKARPVFMRTHSLDSTSGWLLRNKLNSCLSLTRSASPKDPPLPESDVTTPQSLAQRKGPLPPVPHKRDTGTSSSSYYEHLNQKITIPLPPTFPAPKLNIYPTAVKKSASFSPGGNSSLAIPQKSLEFSDDL